MITLQGPTPARQAAMQRATRLLRRLPDGTTAAEDAMLRVLAAAEKGDPEALAAAVLESCSLLAPSAARLDIGALAITCWIAAADVKAAGEHVGALVAVLRERVAELSSTPEKVAESTLVSWAGALLARRLGRPPPIGGIHWSLLPAPMLVANVTAGLQELAAQRDTAGVAAMRVLSEALTALEGRLWDHPQRSGEDFWRSTGGTGAALVSVIQRSREIGILRAMGMSRGRITRVFLLQGALVGVGGSLLGSGLGAALALGFSSAVTDASGGPLLPIVLDARLFLTSAAVATTTGVLAALLPARRAAKLDPATAIRNA